ncbi:MAG: DNA polymerase II [Sandaracinus sp.]|nr:DNA polymerase II [Sandaracinus sp.]
METVEIVLLTRQWFDRDDGVRLTFWGASADGPVKVVFHRQEAVMFVDRNLTLERGRRQPVELQSLQGRPVDAVYFATQRELIAERQRLRERVLRTQEGDVKPHDRFLMERFVTGSLAVRGEVRQRDGYRELVDPRVKACTFDTPLSVLSLDIETDGYDGPLLSIAVAGAGGERVWMVGTGPAVAGLGYVADERALLEAFLEHVRRADPDVLTGWNVVDFDLLTLQRLAERERIPFALGRGGERAKVLPPRSDQQPYVVRVGGRVVLDGIATLKAATWSFESFSLEHVGQKLLGRGKRIAHDGDPVAEIRRLYREDKPALAAYNLEDCRLVLDIVEAADLLGFAVQRQALTGLPLDRQGGSVAAFDNLYLPRLHRRGYVAPDVGDARGGERSPGGYVMDSVPGLYENVVVLDFKSLYPSIIRTFAVDPLGLATAGADPIPGFAGGAFAREGHILPGLIQHLWEARDEAKRSRDEARSRAIKILMNSFYGVLGTPGCRFFSPLLASSITLRGHEIITESRAFIEARGYAVIYGDTDSLFVHVGGSDADASAATGRTLAADLNDHWRTTLRERHRIESALEVEYERNFVRFLMPTMRHSTKGSKKRYAGLVRTGGGEKLVVKGLEAARTDWTSLARRFQRELLDRVFHDQPWRDWLRELAAEVRAGHHDDELVYRKRLRRALADYQANVPPHVQAARKLGRPTKEIRYVITGHGPEPVDLPHGALDHEHYLQKQLAPAADAILPFLGTTFETLAGTQMSLFG